MSAPAPKSVRRRFLAAVGRGLYVTWPVLSGVLVIEGRPGPTDRFRRGMVVGRGSLLLLHHRPHHWLWRYRAAAGAHARTRGRDRLWRHPPDRPGGWNRRQCHACDPDGRG